MSIQSDLVQLEALEGQYKTKLTQYESAYATYISSLQQDSNTNSFVVLPGKSYAGPNIISDTPDSTLTMCEASCKANPLCGGASFNSISNVCKLYGGNGGLRPGATSDNAIITNIKKNIFDLETLNRELLMIHQKIADLYSKMQPLVGQHMETINTNGEELSNRYSLLMDEKNKIKRLQDEYKDVNKSYTDQSLMVEQRNYTYYLWFIFCIVSILLVIKLLFYSEEKILSISTIISVAIILAILLFFVSR